MAKCWWFHRDTTGFSANALIPSVRAHVSSDGQSLVASNLLTGFDLYDLDSGDLVRAFGHDVGDKRATPVKFTELDDAIVGGTTVGMMHVWDANTGRRVQTMLHSGGLYPPPNLSMFRLCIAFTSRSPKNTCLRCQSRMAFATQLFIRYALGV